MQLELTDYEAVLLHDMLQMKTEEMADTREKMLEDNRTLSSFDDFVDVMQKHEINTNTLETVRHRLIGLLHENKVDANTTWRQL